MYNAGDPSLDMPYSSSGFFAQDSWRIHPNVTLNFGFRYNYHYCKGLDIDTSNIRHFNPRFGFSWDPVGDGKTSIRGGIGTYSANPVWNGGLYAGFLAEGSDLRIIYYPNYPDPSKPNPFFPSITVMTSSEFVEIENLIVPYTLQATFGFLRELSQDISVGADFVWARGYRLHRMENANPVIPGTLVIHEDPTRADVWMMKDRAISNYKGLYLTFNKRYSRGWALEISYTLSKSMADTEIETDQNHNYEDLDFIRQYGPTNFDARHRLSIAGIFDLPFGFQLSGLFYFRSALPWNAVYSYDKNSDSLVSDYVDEYRNSRRGFDSYYLNLRISNNLKLGRFGLQPFIEVYNVTNRANFATIRTLYDFPDFANPIAAGNPRLVQLGARLDF